MGYGIGSRYLGSGFRRPGFTCCSAATAHETPHTPAPTTHTRPLSSLASVLCLRSHIPAGSAAGGKRPRSSMTPTLVFDAEMQPVVALGSPGGSRIIGTVLNALVALLDSALPPLQALAAPRVISRNGETEMEVCAPACASAVLLVAFLCPRLSLSLLCLLPSSLGSSSTRFSCRCRHIDRQQC